MNLGAVAAAAAYWCWRTCFRFSWSFHTVQRKPVTVRRRCRIISVQKKSEVRKRKGKAKITSVTLVGDKITSVTLVGDANSKAFAHNTYH